MILQRLIGILLFVYVTNLSSTVHSADKAKTSGTKRPASTADFTIREIDGPIDHNHCTTRQFHHMSFHHEGVWFVFYSDGKEFRYQTSDNSGRTWKRSDDPVAPAPNGSGSFDVLQVGDTVYVSHLQTTDGKLYGNLYNGETWGDRPVLIADDLTTVAGDGRRLAVEFDPTQKRLHLIYVDVGNRLRYHHLDSPYRPSDWQPAIPKPGLEVATGVFTAALSVDSSSNPYGLVITYGVEKHLGKDIRRRTGELYTRRFNGLEWQSDPVLVSQRGTIHNSYPNVNQDANDGLCVLYLSVAEKISYAAVERLWRICNTRSLRFLPAQKVSTS
jgi:hypothetical protein